MLASSDDFVREFSFTLGVYLYGLTFICHMFGPENGNKLISLTLPPQWFDIIPVTSSLCAATKKTLGIEKNGILRFF